MRVLLIAALCLAGCDMRTTVLSPLGLITRPNKYGQYPPGGMEIARNVMMRDPGIVRAFPDVTQYRADVMTSGNTTRRMFAGSSSLLTFSENAGTWGARWVTSGASSAISMPTSLTLSMGTGQGGVAKVRNRFIAATSSDLIVMDSEGDTTARYPGILAPSIRHSSSTTTNASAIENLKYAGYRAIIRRTSSDGYVLQSAPSSQMIVFNPGGGTRDPSIHINLIPLTGVLAGDVVEIYRTKAANTASVGSTHFLAVSYTITSTDITNQFAVVRDIATDAALTVELYTNPGQGGINQASYAPPVATDIASFKGYTFFVSTAVAEYKSVRIAGPLSDALSTTAERTYGIGVRATTGDTTLGSAAILNVANTTGLVPGQQISCANFSPVAVISSVIGTTVTMNLTATATTVGVAMSFADLLEVNGITQFSMGICREQLGTSFRVSFSAVPVTNLATGVTSSSTTGTECLIEKLRHATPAALTIRATNGQNYYPALPEITASVTNGSTDARTNRIHWSKLDEPEAVAVLNFAFVGNGAIHRIISTRDALWLFCSDGLFRLSGINGQWRADPVDPTLVLAARKAVCTLGQDVWAYTNRGLVVISPEGIVTRVTEDILGDVLPGAPYGDTWDTFMAGDEKHGEVLLTFRTGTTSLTYVYNVNTKAFTTWEPSAAANGQDISTDAFTVTDMVWYPLNDSIAFAAGTGTSGNDADVGYFGSDTSSNRFVGSGQVIRFQPISPQGEPFSLVQFMDTGWLFEDAETLVAVPTFGTLTLANHTIADGGPEDRLTVGVPRAAAIHQRLRPGIQLTSSAKNWSLRGMSMRWVPLSREGKR